MFSLIFGVNPCILVVMSQEWRDCKIWNTLSFFQQCFQHIKVKHINSYDRIVIVAFKEMMPTNFYWNIKSHRQYNEYMENNKN